MYVCEEHNIAYEDSTCPMCEADIEIADLDAEIEKLKQDLEEAQSKEKED